MTGVPSVDGHCLAVLGRERPADGVKSTLVRNHPSPNIRIPGLANHQWSGKQPHKARRRESKVVPRLDKACRGLELMPILISQMTPATSANGSAEFAGFADIRPEHSPFLYDLDTGAFATDMRWCPSYKFGQFPYMTGHHLYDMWIRLYAILASLI